MKPSLVSTAPARSSGSAAIKLIGKPEKSIATHSSDSSGITPYYRISANIRASTGKSTLMLGNGIKGQPLADGLLKLIADELHDNSR